MQNVLVLSLVFCVKLAGAEHCPFLNAATAAGLAGGKVLETFVSSSKTNDDGICRFVRAQPPLRTELLIDVETMTDRARQFGAYVGKCDSSKTSLRALGNEAIACSGIEKAGQHNEQIIGRVRDRAFAIKLTSTDPGLTTELLKVKARLAAEQVAGNLF